MENNLPDLLSESFNYLGFQEKVNGKSNPKILKWFKELKLSGIKDTSIPWCGGFVAYCALKSGRKYPSDFMTARNWGAFPGATKLDKPALGAVVVFWRESIGSWKGHVGILAGIDENGNYAVIGGNQSNMVKISPYNDDRIIGFYWLHKTDGTGTVPNDGRYKIPVIQTDGKYLENEQ